MSHIRIVDRNHAIGVNNTMKTTKRSKMAIKSCYRMPQARRKEGKPYPDTPAKRSPAWFARLIEYLYPA